MIEAIHSQLNALKNLINGLTDHEYSVQLDILSGSSIGQHVRHILEFYTCVLGSLKGGEVCYDNRKRDIRIETDRFFTNQLIESLSHAISHCPPDQRLKLLANFSNESDKANLLETSFYRELAYALEHGIHHQALVKIGVVNLGQGELLDETFGVAPATIRYQKALPS